MDWKLQAPLRQTKIKGDKLVKVNRANAKEDMNSKAHKKGNVIVADKGHDLKGRKPSATKARAADGQKAETVKLQELEIVKN